MTPNSEQMYSTTDCAKKLNLAYGWKAVSRQRIHRDIQSGRLPTLQVPAAGTRERSLIQVPRTEFLAYSEVYHPGVMTALRAICNN